LTSETIQFNLILLRGFTNGWLTIAKGDYDDVDGDIDIMIGSFSSEGLRKKNSKIY
jgi:hypothetical protein